MTKTFAFIITAALFLGSLTTLAAEENQYSRGLIIAVDTRDHAQCEMAQKTVQGMTTAKVTQVCAQDGRNPYAVIIITVPMSEFDYSNATSPAFGAKVSLTAINNPQLGTMFIYPRAHYTDQYFHVMSRREKASITIFRQSDFGDMDFRRENALLLAFLLKSNSSQQTSKKIASSVGKRLVFNRGSFDMNESQYRSQATKAASIMDSINGTIQDAINTDRASLNLFMPPKTCRKDTGPCPNGDGYGFGLSVTIRF
ncbi:hypothetical protein [Bdellovibrio sp. BCCA]|uniref:hypothetical protein n=1 Tax=Bdellovibrio sp. BCCA TaxID=3136281 RepID=UPI0030F20E54